MGNPGVSMPNATDQIAGPDLTAAVRGLQSMPKITAGEERASTSDAVASSTLHASSNGITLLPRTLDVASVPIRVKPEAKVRGRGVRLVGPTLASASVESASVAPQIGLSPIDGSLGPGKLAIPTRHSCGPRKERKPLLKKFGGTKQSEEAVDLGLAYLARMQEPDGRWTRVEDDRERARRPRDRHDMACTGFAVLAFLAHDDVPDLPGPYRASVSKAIDYLISMQDDDGDLRGPRRFRGGGSDSANMYDQGIATYALAECGIMTHDPKVIAAALKGAEFIVRAQDQQSGGWRYSPGEYGDSSVFGWQIMACTAPSRLGLRSRGERSTAPSGTCKAARKARADCWPGISRTRARRRR